jgi:glycosyltransferase involved in cell wall biosynthesis
MKNKLTLAYVVPALFYPSGMERVLTAKVNYFVNNFGYEIHIFLTDGKGKDPYYPLDPRVNIHHLDINFDGIFTHPLLQRTFIYFKKQRLFKKRLAEKLKHIKPDITVSLLRRDINFINDIDDGSLKVGELHFNKLFYRQFTDNRFPVFLQRIISNIWQQQLLKNLRRLNAFVVLSYEDAGHWTALDNVSVIHNPLSFYPDEASPLTNKQVLAVGRITHQKGFDKLIEGWNLVHMRHPDWILRIYGGGEVENLQKMINHLGLTDSCFLEGGSADIGQKYKESSIFALSSRYEGFPMVLVETMAYGVPAVAFACPCGPRDIIDDGEDGLLVENGNISMLADRICFLIEDDNERKRLGANARNNIKRLEIDHIAQEWKKLFDALIRIKEG